MAAKLGFMVLALTRLAGCQPFAIEEVAFQAEGLNLLGPAWDDVPTVLITSATCPSGEGEGGVAGLTFQFVELIILDKFD